MVIGMVMLPCCSIKCKKSTNLIRSPLLTTVSSGFKVAIIFPVASLVFLALFCAVTDVLLCHFKLIDLGCNEKLCFKRLVVGFLFAGMTGACFFVNMILTFQSWHSNFIWFHTWLSTNRDSCGRRIRVLIMIFLLDRLLASELLIDWSCSICSTRQ